MTAPTKLSPSMQKAVFRVETSTLQGNTDNDALSLFVEGCGSIPLARVAQFEHDIRVVINEARNAHNRRMNWKRQQEHQFVVPWFDLFSSDGFRRERALRTIRSEAPNPFLLAVLLRRLNDWVPQVRAAARAAAETALNESDTEVVAAVAWVMLPVRASWGRMGKSDLQVLDMLTERASVAMRLAEEIEAARSGPATNILRQASRGPALDQYLPQLAAQAAQPSVRSLAYRMLLQRRSVWQVGWQWRWTDKSLGERVREPKLSSRSIEHDLNTDFLIEAAANDPAAVVRRVAGDGLIARNERLSEFDLKLARQLATDRYPSVAERAQFILKRVSSN